MDVEKLGKAPITLGVALALGAFLAGLGWLFLSRVETNLARLQDAQGSADKTLAVQGRDIENIRGQIEKVLNPPPVHAPPPATATNRKK